MRIRRAQESSSELINITSLIDVMFILIIFFLTTTTFQQEERDIQVNLPEASKAEALSSAPRIVVINVREDGTYFMGDRALQREELQPVIVKTLQDNPEQKVLVRGDQNARHGHVAAAVLAAKQAGVHEANIGYQLAP
jgi:biopolymer transport protein ExbD